ncbi:MAG TPA: hypothetical protein VH165_29580 [Kofleriaceae bacterium]|nr:hypothetical protein [Kofleriaceae bacterium]
MRVVLCARGAARELAGIAGALRARGAEPIVVDSAAFPSGATLNLAYDRAGFGGRWGGAGGAGGRGGPDGDEPHAWRDVAAVWQRAVVGVALPAMADGVRETCVAASERAVIGWLDSLDVFQLDPHGCQQRADNKPHQLRVAQQVGLDIPATLISNDPDAVRAFAGRTGPLIMKMLVQPASPGPAAGSGGGVPGAKGEGGGRDGSGAVGGGEPGAEGDGGPGGEGEPGAEGEDEGEADVVFTTALTADELARLDGLDLCPMIFQERIENRLDVRVTVAGRQVNAAALDRVAHGGAGLDWRRDSYAQDRAPRWVPYALPPAIADAVLRLLDRYALNYGAADFIVRPDGSHVFLELNASGSFAFLGDDLARPIAAAIAAVLVDPGARRVP